MLKALVMLLKLAVFSIVILLAGQWISWDGRTLSQHMQAQLARAGQSEAAHYVRGLTRRVTEDARSGFEKKIRHRGHGPASAHASRTSPASGDTIDITDQTETQSAAPLKAAATDLDSERPLTHQPSQQGELRTVAHAEEQIRPSERQKLRALIRELNSANN